jgi:hypothetical protein
MPDHSIQQGNILYNRIFESAVIFYYYVESDDWKRNVK